MRHHWILKAIGAVDRDAVAASYALLLQHAPEAARRLPEAPICQALAVGRDEGWPLGSLGHRRCEHMVQWYLGIGLETDKWAMDDHHTPPRNRGMAELRPSWGAENWLIIP